MFFEKILPVFFFSEKKQELLEFCIVPLIQQYDKK